VKRLALTMLAALGCAPRAPAPRPALAPVTVEQVSHTSALLQAISVVNDSVVWVSGHGGTYVRTTDGGRTWIAAVMPGQDSLQFRDVHAASADTAWLLAAGPGERSRIYRTDDAGRTWRLQFQNSDSAAFYDCFAFRDARRGVAVSDAVAGRLIIIRTEDGGAHWERVSDAGIPPALPGEGAFAASGTCLAVQGGRHAWIGTGAASGARVYRTEDGGRTWSVATTPVASGEATGIASVVFRDALNGLALGGPVSNADARTQNVARTTDGGRTWSAASSPTFPGAVYGAAAVPGAPGTVAAVGPRGLDVSADDGATWTPLLQGAFWAVGFAGPRSGWAVGPRGRIVKISLTGRAP
jgi:photosystem II stability/assembly factor-like uncharacterized protein